MNYTFKFKLKTSAGMIVNSKRIVQLRPATQPMECDNECDLRMVCVWRWIWLQTGN